MILYIALDMENKELPLFVSESLQEMANKFNKSVGCISSSISKKHNGKIKFIRIEVEE